MSHGISKFRPFSLLRGPSGTPRGNFEWPVRKPAVDRRVNVRVFQSNVNAALVAYDKAVDASGQREVRLLCLHEVAWCHLIRLSYEEAYRSLTQLQQQSRWSKSFYAYLAAGNYRFER